MKWLTIPEIKRRSKTAKGALNVSYEHWCQLYDAKAKELREKYEKTRGLLDSADYCGLCIYYCKTHSEYSKCLYCIFSVNAGCGGDLWGNANTALDEWAIPERYGSWHEWKRACKKVRDKLFELKET